MNRDTSPEIATIAARLMEHPDPDVRCVAASALSQREVDSLNERAWSYFRPFFNRMTDWGQSEAGRAALGIRLGACIMEAVCDHLEALPELQAEHERIVARLTEALRFYAAGFEVRFDEGLDCVEITSPSGIGGFGVTMAMLRQCRIPIPVGAFDRTAKDALGDYE